MKHSKEDAVKNVTNYIVNRASGLNKQESALKADYSETTARKPMVVEGTKTYQAIIDQVLTKNANMMLILAQSLYDDMKSDKIDALKPQEKAQIYKIITDTNDKIMPKVTLKESTDKNGNVTRTAWAQNASQVQEVLTDKGDIEGDN
jgi:hypothetical protein